MSALMTREGEVITGKLFPGLLDYLHVGDVKPHLLAEKVITREEYEQLQVGHRLTSERAVAESLVLLLSRKPKGATRLLEALEKTVTGPNPQTAHYNLIHELRRELERCGEVRSDGPQALPPSEYQPQYSLPNGTENRTRRGDSDNSAVKNTTDLTPNLGASNEPISLLQYKPHLDSSLQERLRVHLASESRSILEEFTSFVLDVGAQLKSASTDVEEIKLALEARLGKDVNNRTLQRIEEASTVPRLLRIAMPFSSWYNYDLVAYLAKRYGGTRGEELVANYEKHFEAHLKRRVVTCPPVLSDDAAVPNGFQKFMVVVDWKLEDCTLQDVTIFKEKLCKHLHIDDPARFILKSISEGCVRLSFILPTSMAEHTWARAIAVKMELVEEQVISIHMEGKSFNFKKEVHRLPEIVTNSINDLPHSARPGHNNSFPSPELSQRLLQLISEPHSPSTDHDREKPALSPLATYTMKAGHSPNGSPTSPRKKILDQRMKPSPENSPLLSGRQHVIESPTSPETSLTQQVVLRQQRKHRPRGFSHTKRSSIRSQNSASSIASDPGYASQRNSADVEGVGSPLHSLVSPQQSSDLISPDSIALHRLSDPGYSTPPRRMSEAMVLDEHKSHLIVEEPLNEEMANVHVHDD